jgi:hypothetical protein
VGSVADFQLDAAIDGDIDIFRRRHNDPVLTSTEIIFSDSLSSRSKNGIRILARPPMIFLRRPK